MNEPETSCPAPEELNKLLQLSLPSDEQATLQAHIENCSACQDHLASLVAGSESWDAALDHLRGEVPVVQETLLSDVVERMKSDNPGVKENSNSEYLKLLTPSDHPDSIGLLGAYEVSEIIGQGGMGIVFKAFDPSLHRVVAVKVLAPYLAHNPHARKRFVREAQAIAAVSHDHVITIHAIDEFEEQPKIVMQYVAGQSLQQKIDASGSLELKEILRIGMQTASGLAAAHAQGLVHRDVKPSNILLENGVQRVRLTDFGLARAVDDASLTQSGVIAGTPQYMAPEQANGEAVDFRADLFSLGSVMYAMCVGHSPFRASTTMGVLKRVCHDSPRPIQEMNPDIPDWLSSIVMKLLAKKPEDRLPNAKAVADLLEKWLAHVQQPTIVAPPFDVTIDAGTVNDKIPSQSRPAESRTQMASTGNGDTYARTIFFQPVSARLFIFLTLTGMTLALTTPGATRNVVDPGERLLASLGCGLVFCMAALLCISLYRFIHANLTGKPVPTVTGMHNAIASKKILAPENIAMLAAIGLLVVSSNLLLAAIAAIIVWRFTQDDILHGRVETNPAPLGSGDSQEATSSSTGNSVFFAGLMNACTNGIDQVTSLVRRISGLSNVNPHSNWLSVGWFLSCGLDLIGLCGPMLRTLLLPVKVATIVMSVVSLAVTYCITVRQSPQFVYAMSFAGLLPVSPGALLRIPVSFLTLYWMDRPGFRETFDQLPWPETPLGRNINGTLSFFRRFAATFLLLCAWTLGFALVIDVGIAYIVVPYFPAEYHVYDEARAIVRGTQPPFNLRLTAIGTGRVNGLQHYATAYRRQSLRIRTQGSAGSQQLLVRLGGMPTNVDTGTELTLKEIESCLAELPEDQMRPTAENLLQTVITLNRLATSDNQRNAPLRSLGFRERFELFGDAIRRGAEPVGEEEAAHADENVINVTDMPIYHHQFGKPVDFQTIASMLNNKLLNVTSNSAMTNAGCFFPFANFLLEALTCLVTWLVVCVLIVKRRHFSRKTGLASAVAA